MAWVDFFAGGWGKGREGGVTGRAHFICVCVAVYQAGFHGN